MKKTKNSRNTIKKLGGRPPKYHDKFIEVMYEYFNVPAIDEKTKEAVQFPTMDKFAADIGVLTHTLTEWATIMRGGKLKYPKFSTMYYRCKQMQKDILVANALRGKYASNFAIFVATNMTDMVDRKEIDATSNGETIGGFNYIVPEKPKDAHSEDNNPDD